MARRLRDECPPATPAEYRAQVADLWALTHREEKYLAIDVAQAHRRFITFEQLHLYERLVREGAWWDVVDEIAAHLVGRVVMDDRERLGPPRCLSGNHPRTVIRCQDQHDQDRQPPHP